MLDLFNIGGGDPYGVPGVGSGYSSGPYALPPGAIPLPNGTIAGLSTVPSSNPSQDSNEIFGVSIPGWLEDVYEAGKWMWGEYNELTDPNVSGSGQFPTGTSPHVPVQGGGGGGGFGGISPNMMILGAVALAGILILAGD